MDGMKGIYVHGLGHSHRRTTLRLARDILGEKMGHLQTSVA